MPDSLEPQWRPPDALDSKQLPAATRAWLLDEESLTERLVAASGGNFAVSRISQGMSRPFATERAFLSSPATGAALIREVALTCHGEPWVYARSVIPESSLSGPLQDLKNLGNESLGARIFSEPSLQRSKFEVCLLPAHSVYVHRDYRQAAPAWARRSLFLVEELPLLVSEVFLDNFTPWTVSPPAHPSA